MPQLLDDIQEKLTSARSEYSRYIRNVKLQNQTEMDSKMSDLLLSDPNKIYSMIRKEKSASSQISTLRVGQKIFDQENICNGFYESLSNLKSPDMSQIASSPALQETMRDYENVMKLAKYGGRLPDIQLHETAEILHSVRKDVNDLFSITASHFINAGESGIRHFHQSSQTSTMPAFTS